MNTTSKTLFAGTIALFILLGAFTSDVRAGDRLSISTSIDYASKYMWRGINISDDAVLQPSIGASTKALGGSISVAWWGNMDLSGVDENEFTEHDWTISYAIDALGGSIDTGISYYYYPQAGAGGVDNTADAYFTYSAKLGELPLSANVGVYYEFIESDGIYVTAGLSSEHKVTEKWTLGLGTSVGWGTDKYNAFMWGVDDSAMNDLAFNVSMSAPIDANSSISIGVNYVELLDSDLEDAVEAATGGQSDSVWFVAGIKVAF